MTKKLDLDNLLPETAELTIGGETLTVQPPSLRILFIVNKLAQKLNNLQGTATADDVEAVQAEIKLELNKVIPGLDKHELSSAQLLKIVELVVEMATPQEDETTTGEATVKPDPKAPTA